MKAFFWKLGRYDLAGIFEAPDDASMAAVGVSICAAATFGHRRCELFPKKT
ncbi:MAG TPA: GYD domain-containing protein [Dongiaceae bacterium]|nr:GYD domain-containing protein [Dongiaceae bacterium]